MTALLDLAAPPASGGSAAGGRSVVGAAVEDAAVALETAAEAALWPLRDVELAELVVAAGRLAARAQGLLLRLVGEADARDALTADGATGSAAFLRHRLRMSPAEAASCARTARTVRAEAEATGAACASGRVSGGQAAVIARAVRDLPAGPVRAEAERTLLQHARPTTRPFSAGSPAGSPRTSTPSGATRRRPRSWPGPRNGLCGGWS